MFKLLKTKSATPKAQVGTEPMGDITDHRHPVSRGELETLFARELGRPVAVNATI